MGPCCASTGVMQQVDCELHRVPDGSDVSLSARLEEVEGAVFVVISVSHNGEGIEPQVLDKIFQPFFTTKATGTGLGLAIAHRAVSGHGGEIRVDNRYGEGVTFSIYLPAARITGNEE